MAEQNPLDWMEQLMSSSKAFTWYGWEGEELTIEEWINLSMRGVHVGDTYIRKFGQVFRVSTVLLGKDQAWGRYPKPLIFETMTFANNSVEDAYTNGRYFTKKQAIKGHRETVKRVRRLSLQMPTLIHKGGKPHARAQG